MSSSNSNFDVFDGDAGLPGTGVYWIDVTPRFIRPFQGNAWQTPGLAPAVQAW